MISNKQRVWLFTTIGVMFLIIATGFIPKPSKKIYKPADFNTTMSIKEMALKFGVTRKSLARELNLPLSVRKGKPVKTLGITNEELRHVVEHILSHTDATLKYYIYAALVLGGLVFLVRLGRIAAGFLLGKSPNPMEAIVKVCKSMVGLYPDPIIKVIALLFFIILAIVGNKIICTECGACSNVCPTEAAKGIVAGNKMPADCFSCGRCLNSCPVDAIKYTFKNNKSTVDS